MYPFKKGDFVSCPKHSSYIVLATVVKQDSSESVLVEVLIPKDFDGHDGDGSVTSLKGWYVDPKFLRKVDSKPNPVLMTILGGDENE